MIRIFIPHYLPCQLYGGPVFSVSRLVAAFKKNSNYRYQVVTSDRTYDNKKIPFSDRFADTIYLKQGFLHPLLFLLFKTNRNDVIYLNSFFHRYSSLPVFIVYLVKYCIRQNSILLISPRGELLAPRINGKSKVVKLIYSFFFGLFFKPIRRIHFHATSVEEVNAIKKFFPGKHIFKIKNIPAIEFLSTDVHLTRTQSTLAAANRSTHKIIFFSRVSPEKGLHSILDKLCHLSIPYAFHIYGRFSDPSYQSTIFNLINSLKLDEHVKYMGSYNNADLPDIASLYSIFLYNPIAENFSHVYFEACFLRLIPLAPLSFPWRFGIKHLDDFLFFDPLSDTDLINKILRLSSMSSIELSALSDSIVSSPLIKDISFSSVQESLAMFGQLHDLN